MRWVEVSTQAQLDALKPGEGAIVRGGVFRAYGSSTVTAYGSSTVRAYDSSTVTAYGSSTVRAYGSSTVTACDSSTVTACDSSTVRAYGSSTVRAYDSSTVTAYDSSTVTACDSSTVRACDSSTVRACDSSTVTAYDSSTVRAYDSSTVTASAFVATHHLSERARVTGGVIIKPKTDTPADWCDFYGVKVSRGRATLFKAVEDDWRGTHKTTVTYEPGSKPVAPDWSPEPACGNGLHLSPRPFMARRYCETATKYLACTVAVKDIVMVGDKVKVPRCTVLYEVDEDGVKVAV